MVVIENGHISLKKIDWDQMFCAYLMISRHASLEPIYKGHNLLFVLDKYLSTKSTVLP